MIPDKPTPEQLKKELLDEKKAIAEIMQSPAGKILIKHWRKMTLFEIFDKDPYVMAYRAALHDFVNVLIDIAEGN